MTGQPASPANWQPQPERSTPRHRAGGSSCGGRGARGVVCRMCADPEHYLTQRRHTEHSIWVRCGRPCRLVVTGHNGGLEHERCAVAVCYETLAWVPGTDTGGVCVLHRAGSSGIAMGPHRSAVALRASGTAGPVLGCLGRGAPDFRDGWPELTDLGLWFWRRRRLVMTMVELLGGGSLVRKGLSDERFGFPRAGVAGIGVSRRRWVVPA